MKVSFRAYLSEKYQMNVAGTGFGGPDYRTTSSALFNRNESTTLNVIIFCLMA